MGSPRSKPGRPRLVADPFVPKIETVEKSVSVHSWRSLAGWRWLRLFEAINREPELRRGSGPVAGERKREEKRTFVFCQLRPRD